MDKTTLIVMMFAAATAFAACGNDENNASNNGANNTVNNVANNTANNETSNNTANNTVNNETSNNTTPDNSSNTTGNNPRTEPFITRFAFFKEDDSIGSNEGYTISVVSGDIANQDGNSRTMTAEDAAAFEADYLGADLIAKMRNGFGCPDVVVGGDMGDADMGVDAGGAIDITATYVFDARIQEGDTVRSIQDVTGCVLADDPEVLELIDAITALGAFYL